MPISSWKLSSDTTLVRSATKLLTAAQRLEPGYAGARAPTTTSDFARMLRRATCKVHFLEPRPGARAITIPPIAGYYWIGVKRELSEPERTFALRHELAGDPDGSVCMVDPGYLTQGERLPDLFALADLIAGHYLQTLRSMRLRWREIHRDIEAQVRADFGPDWPEARVQDRAALRVRLHRECGI